MSTALSPTTFSPDERVHVLATVRELAQRHGDALRVSHYEAAVSAERQAAQMMPDVPLPVMLPPAQALTHVFGSFEGALAAAGVRSEGGARWSTDELVAALREVAGELGDEFSSHQYDAYRKTGAPHLPSSNVLRKWLGGWEGAMEAAALRSTKRAKAAFSLWDVTKCLLLARGATPAQLTPASYDEFWASRPQAERAYAPTSEQIVERCVTWDAALTLAEVATPDALDARGVWTAQELTAIAAEFEQRFGALTAELYEPVWASSKALLPPWSVLSGACLGAGSPHPA